MKRSLNDKYFNWMYDLVCNEKYNRKLSYRKLLRYLHDIQFTYIFELDSNRAEDGIDFRYRFGYEFGIERDVIWRTIDNGRPCSVLEMMIALAFRVEEHIMDDSQYGDRTGQWFWSMIVSLGLGTMSDQHFDEIYVEDVIYRFLNREYASNGKGGLFTIDNYNEDLRDVEIWTQCMWYLNEVIED